MASKYQENGNGDTEKPLIVKHDADQTAHKEELVMVYLSTAVAVCGSYAFGTCVGYSSPTQFSIMDELNLSYSQYSVFGSILTIGAMLGAITAGRIADLLGRKGAMRLSSVICSAGWLAIYLAKVCSLRLGSKISGLNHSFLHFLTYKMTINVNMLCPFMKCGICSNLDGNFTIIMK
uniref:Sugar transporter ERD6-like 8 isoform X1 n=1 Tax=Nicotiana tabacum TaxID=4097 RepID=A0A1S4A8H6_TOBAC|nr:PREDICTED: sugar transporter ERD6-like 8 isoform X1 [Nicotiana tabacum]